MVTITPKRTRLTADDRTAPERQVRHSSRPDAVRPGAPRPDGSAPSRPRHVRQRDSATSEQTIAAVFVALLIATLFGSDGLVGLAERQQLGWKRSVALQTAEGVDRVADFFSLDRPASALAALRGKDTSEVDLDALLAPTAGPATGQSTATSNAPSSGSATQDASATAASAPSTTGATVPPTTVRTVSAAAPLDIYVGGDSMGREVGQGLLRQAPVDLSTIELDFQVSTGLSRPDFYDWPQRLAKEVTESPPDVAVLIFGTNDAQGFFVDGVVAEFGSEAWLAEYRSRVGTVMDLLGQPGVQVIWVGIPPMRSASFDGSMATLDEIYRSEAESREWIHYISTRSVFAGTDGGYAQSISSADGTKVDVRQADGVHWSFDGADLVGDLVWAEIAEIYDVTDA